ncbi:MAG: hypothetical protein COV59_01050 [Candidatus Magasanikbacteria bacterium CG11_big_fil_rev_8_21_14_0_20_39_34]|uniref:Uncharacterized protein n=1 Tax=Candidatus Magasanikbacteria bacterium CG11_big_fil_rev_8_21_14_0_20_39_34 TaxID=1974653 RepID=A0A2H0N6B1_9BACT|nr:MAG: hypothetical protein COV59_01050 [Candidatus Magasanikbacteria bacterium CG11_big_fil_rev_8_21_14_0_20_39_34]
MVDRFGLLFWRVVGEAVHGRLRVGEGENASQHDGHETHGEHLRCRLDPVVFAHLVDGVSAEGQAPDEDPLAPLSGRETARFGAVDRGGTEPPPVEDGGHEDGHGDQDGQGAAHGSAFPTNQKRSSS